MDIETKIKEDMKSLGCESPSKIALAYHLYIYLVDKKLMYDTEYCFNRDVDTLYIVARPSKSDKLNIYVPVPTTTDVSMTYITFLQENLCTVETGHTINLAFIEGDFTTVIYTFTKGLLDITDPNGLIRRRTREERRNFIDSEIRSKKKEILDKALNGGVVDGNDCEVID